jgi:hypothetical protein
MSEAKPKRRWFRYSLRALLVLVTLAAFGSWAYWIGWPWWQDYREQMEFEQSIRQLKVGSSRFNEPMPAHCQFAVTMSSLENANKEPVVFGVYACKSACYCICYVNPGFSPENFLSHPGEIIEAYRLPALPPRYLRIWPRWQTAIEKYIYDFWNVKEFNQTEPKIAYELIYSDPPAKPMQ